MGPLLQGRNIAAVHTYTLLHIQTNARGSLFRSCYDAAGGAHIRLTRRNHGERRRDLCWNFLSGKMIGGADSISQTVRKAGCAQVRSRFRSAILIELRSSEADEGSKHPECDPPPTRVEQSNQSSPMRVSGCRTSTPETHVESPLVTVMTKSPTRTDNPINAGLEHTCFASVNTTNSVIRSIAPSRTNRLKFSRHARYGQSARNEALIHLTKQAIDRPRHSRGSPQRKDMVLQSVAWAFPPLRVGAGQVVSSSDTKKYT
jgi:hypothetical protein